MYFHFNVMKPHKYGHARVKYKLNSRIRLSLSHNEFSYIYIYFSWDFRSGVVWYKTSVSFWSICALRGVIIRLPPCLRRKKKSSVIQLTWVEWFFIYLNITSAFRVKYKFKKIELMHFKYIFGNRPYSTKSALQFVKMP